MIGFSTLRQLFTNVIATGIVKNIYHSVMLKPMDDGGSKPAAPVDGRWKYVGFNDAEGFSCYCRQTGSATLQGSNRIGGCNSKINRFQVPTKLVFFNDDESRSHEDLIAKLVGAIMKTSFVSIQAIVINPNDILRSEAPTGKFQFKDKTFFVAVDMFILMDLQSDTCTTEIACEGIPNPYCLPSDKEPGCTNINWSIDFNADPGQAPSFIFTLSRNGEVVVNQPTPAETNGSFEVQNGDTIELNIGHGGNFSIYGFSIKDKDGNVIESTGGFSGYIDTSFVVDCSAGPYFIKANA